jgi:hypothetical protein
VGAMRPISSGGTVGSAPRRGQGHFHGLERCRETDRRAMWRASRALYVGVGRQIGGADSG